MAVITEFYKLYTFQYGSIKRLNLRKYANEIEIQAYVNELRSRGMFLNVQFVVVHQRARWQTGIVNIIN